MTKAFAVNSKNWDLAHIQRTEQYAAKVKKLYQDAINEAARIAATLTPDPKKPFIFADHTLARKPSEQLFNSFARRLQANTHEATAGEWLQANLKNDKLVNSILDTSKLSKEQISSYMNRNVEALTAFQNRKVAGMDLSKRVWNYTDQFKQEIEMGLDLGLGQGKSAAQLSRDLRSFLNDPEKLFRRVRDKHGNLQLSKNAKAYHPGRGVYRSSYKNAMRMTRTEVNMAYRTADSKRWNQLDFVVGIEVKLSNNHPVPDICDDLQGKYPKNFLFRGWHTQCRCNVFSVLATEKELNDLEMNILNGESNKGFESVNQVKDIPKGFTDWFHLNSAKISTAKTPPYFISDNQATVKLISDKKIELLKGLGVQERIDLAKKWKMDSSELFTDSKGQYLPERKILHEKIIAEMMGEAKTANGNVFFIGGAPANGKSTLVDSGILPHPEKGQILRVDSDKIKAMLGEYNHMVKTGDKTAAAFVHEESSHISKQLMDRSLDQKKDFILDGINDGDFKKLSEKVSKYRNEGLNSIRADYTTLDSDLSLKLATDRAIKTGREVPTKYIKDMNRGVSEIFPKLVENKTFDQLYLWDTNINKNPRLVFTQIGGVSRIHDKKLWDDFLRKAK